MLVCRVEGCLVLVCLAIILRSNEHYGEVLAMGIAHRVRDCPRDEKEWQKASDRLNCTSGDSSTMNKYHCLPADNLTTLLEVCYTRTRTQVVTGQCMVLVERKHILNNYDCRMFKEGCPNTWYFSDQMYKFPACFEIDPLLHCYKADASCRPTTWSVTVLSDTTQSTLVNKTTTNVTTADTIIREIDPLPILLPLIGILGIAVIIAILAWKNKWRRKRFFGRKENVQPEEKDEELELLGTANNVSFDALKPLILEMGLNENVQPEGDGEESGPLETEVNESAQPEGDGEESGHLETENDESAQPEGDAEESGHLEEELIENIERFGINYLLQRLPSDQKKFPNIAKKLNIPHEILNWSLENREKFVRSMKAGNITVYNGRAMVIGCARAGKTTLVKKIKGDSDLETTSTSGIEIHSHAFKLSPDESTIIVSTDEEKEKGCLCLAPGTLDILDEITPETSFVVNIPDLPSSTEGSLNSNNDEVVDCTDPGVNESIIIKPVNNLASNVTSPKEKNHAVDIASSLPSSREDTLISNNYEVIDDTDPDLNESNQPTLEQNVDLNDCVASVNMDNLKMLSLLDFAGHSAYYACHHIFFSPRAFYILVVDMTKDLSSVATEACAKKGLIYSEWTYADYIKYWIGSIHTYSSREAPVIVALSHAEDNGADPKKAVEYFHDICRCIPRKLRIHLDESRLFSFRKNSNKNVNDFKKCLVSTVKKQSHWGEKVPISWTKLESVLKTLKEGSKVFPFSNLLGIVLKTNALEINSEEDLINALTFFNETGVILFQTDIKYMIILDVQWFVDAFKCIILDEEHVKDKGNLEDFDDLNESGLLSNNLLKKMWQNDNNFYQYKESLLNHMKRLDMLAELSEEMWYVPCMNKQKFDSSILDNCNVSSRLCFLFEFLPFIIYHRLVAACINKMEMEPWKRSERMCIFHTVTILTCEDNTHRVLIAICDNKEHTHRDFPYSIEVQINVTKPREIDTRLTSKLKKDISDKLTVLTQGISSSEFYAHVGYRCRLETFGKHVESHIIKEKEMSGSEYDCPKCSHPHIVDVDSIRRFWEKDEPHTSSTGHETDPQDEDVKAVMRALIGEFQDVTSCHNSETARYYIDKCQMNINQAIVCYYEDLP
uniref:Uncharacterized protein LOC111112616 isoform X3 n=1 Tax=Crassostrea virginica TaxID=6565 RepID=A0A8B8BRH5_CRAVI|nr:uncharacterized protein LOC111112616 isoform X3 [Crassostrea virginica]